MSLGTIVIQRFGYPIRTSQHRRTERFLARRGQRNYSPVRKLEAALREAYLGMGGERLPSLHDRTIAAFRSQLFYYLDLVTKSERHA